MPNLSMRHRRYLYEYGVIDLKSDPCAEIVDAGAKMLHLIECLEPVRKIGDEDPF